MFWLTGHTHSGTTLLLSLIDGHQDCLVYPVEPFFHSLHYKHATCSRADLIKNFLMKSRNAVHRGPERCLMDHLAGDDGELDLDAVADVMQQLAAHKTFPGPVPPGLSSEAFYSAYFASLIADLKKMNTASGKFLVEASFAALQAGLQSGYPELRSGANLCFKDPIGQFRPGALDWFLNAWPEGKIVFLRREIHARVWSHITHDLRKGRPNVRLSLDQRAFRGLCKSYARDRVYSELLPESDRILKIDYETLVTCPRETMKLVCDFLGIAFTESVTRTTFLGCDASPSTNRTGSSTVSTASLHKWKSNLTRPEQLWISYYLARAAAKSRIGRKAETFFPQSAGMRAA